MNCQQFREIIDSYLGDELLVETNHDVLHHLENCPDCRQELAARRNLRAKLRAVVKNAPESQLDPAFAAQLRTNLREKALRSKWWKLSGDGRSFLDVRMVLAALCLLFVTGFAGIWLKYRNPSASGVIISENQSNTSNDNREQAANTSISNVQYSASPITQAVEIAWHEIASFAVGDHENCALIFKLKEKPISLEEAAKKYGQFNKDLDQAVIKPLQEVFPPNTAGEIKFLEAHSCVFDGRRFSHIVLRRQNHTISVLVTDADLPDEIGQKVVSQLNNNLQVAAFRTKHHAVFVVSDLPAQDNLKIAEVITPTVRQQIKKFEV